MEPLDIVLIALAILGFGLLSRRFEAGIVTAPMAFVAAGLLVGPAGLDLLNLDLDHHFLHGLAEVTLVLVLFTDASRIDLGLLRREHDLPVRMLGLGLPLTIALGAVVAAALFGTLSFWEAAVLAAILAPTDAALGEAVVSNKAVPVRMRQTLNVESGLNDGIALPMVLILLACAGAASETERSLSDWLWFAGLQVGLGPLAGIAVGWLGGWLIDKAVRHEWMSHVFQQISAIALALLAFALAEEIGGNGFIAAFCAGLTIGNTKRGVCHSLYEFGEAEGHLLTILAFFFFGVAMVPEVLPHIDLTVFAYAVLSLTVVRMLPVTLSLLGTGLSWCSHVFLGWFGPRGLASILFLLLVVEGAGLPGGETIKVVVITTILLSIVLHGVSAVPASHWYARQVEQPSGEAMAEHEAVEEMPLRSGR